MSKHQKTPLVTKVLGYMTIAIVAGTAVATFLPSSYYSGAPLSDSADIFSSVEQMVSPLTAPKSVVVAPPASHATSTTPSMHSTVTPKGTIKNIEKGATSTPLSHKTT